MKNILSLLTILTLSLSAYAQFPGCPNVDAGPDQVLPCSQNCTNLVATPFHAGSTSTYTVGGIPHATPISYTAAGGTAVSVGTDDVWSPIITLPFPFCYYGATYTTCKVGSNGAIQFGPAAGGGGHPWSFTANCPSTALVGAGHIFGAYHDIDPSINTGSQTIKWYLVGSAPCRIFVVSFNNIGHFSCTTMRTSQMIVLYETTNVIDVYVKRKDLCTGWNGGRAIVGIQNPAGTVGIAAPGRNATPTWSVPAASSEGWRFTPNGAPIYTTEWLDGGTVIGLGNTITVCPGGTKTYTARTTYTRCDGVTVVETDNVTISYGTLPAPVVTPVPESCAGAGDGSVTIDNPAGAGPYTVSIAGPVSGSFVEPDTPAGVATFTGLTPGLYTYTVLGNNGCSFTGTFTIIAGPTCCTVTAVKTDLLCNGDNTGTATATPGAGGTPPYSYAWTGGAGSSASVTGLAAGTYTVTLTDATGCTATASVTITEPTPVTATNTSTNASCFGVCDGSITITGPSGGTPGYTYSLGAGAFGGSATFGGLCDGTYAVNVQDANGCIFPITGIVITEPTDVTMSIASTTNATCGLSNGALDVDAAGGTPGYTFTLGGTSNATGIFTGLAAGTYSITVTDANGCTETISVTLINLAGPVPFVDILNDVTCNGGLNGSVTIGVTGGTAAYTFALDGGLPQASNTFPAVAAGPHTVLVTDASGCTGSIDFVISEPTALTYTTIITNASCNGLCDGEIAITPSGATPPYTYSDDAGLSFGPSSTLTGLCAGGVNVVVSDANGCLANSLVTITEPTPLTSTAIHTEPSCNGLSDGEIDFSPIGGTPGYTYSTDGGTTFGGIDPVTGIAAGTYTLVVEDANGCQFSFPHTVLEPPPFTFTYIANNPSNCGASDGSFEIIATDGLGPYDYSIDGGVTTQPSGLFTGLFSGLYTLHVTDANGCVDEAFEALSDNVMTSSTVFANDATCHGACDGALGVTQMFGAAPYTYEISSDPGVTQPFGTFTGLCAGTHYVTIEDDGLCIAIEMIVIGEPDTITYTPTLVDITCPGGADGSIDVGAVTGGDGGPYTYSNDGGATFQAGTLFTGLSSGSYDLVVMDGNGCLGTITVTLAEPAPFSALTTITDLSCNGDFSGVIQIVSDGGTSPYTYSTGGPAISPGIFTGLAAGAYTVTTIDAAGCTFDTPLTVNEPAVLTAVYNLTPVSCNTSCDGEVDVDVFGGTSPYAYSSDGGVISGSSDILGGLCAGTYDIYVEDDNGCTVLSSEIITEPTPITMAVAINPATCGLNNGDITITAGGGTPGYTYSKDGGVTFQVSNVFAGLAATSFTIVIQDANGCLKDSVVVVPADATPVIDAIDLVDPLCNGDANGTITITSSAGVGAHQYSIGGAFQASNLFTGLSAGTYTVTVQDANGCLTTQIVDLIDPAVLTYASVNTDLDCFGDFSGSIVLSETGGTPAYQYSTDNGVTFQPTGDFTFISAGTYNIVIQDANGCQVTGVEIITEPSELVVTAQSSNDASCFGFCDGDADVTIAGGTLPYVYNWSGAVAPTTSPTATALCAGTYIVDVVDNHGCTTNATFTIGQPPMLVISSLSSIDVSCNGDCDGEISIISPTATQYSVDGGVTFQVSNTFTGLCAGVYDVVVQNVNGCTESTTVTIIEPTAVVLAPISDITICYDGYGTLAASASGGNAPYNYVWEGTDTTQFYNVNLTAPATFSCTVYDFNGCPSNTQSANVSILPQFIPNVTPDVIVCPGETASWTAGGVGGVTPYYFQYLNSALDTLSDGPATYSYVPTVSETLTLVARDDCWYYDTLLVNVTVLPEVTPTFTVDPAAGCSPLTVTFTNTTPPGMLGGSCIWDFGNGSSSSLCDLPTSVYYTPGCYDVTLDVVSADGCTGSTTMSSVICVYEDPIAGFYWTPNSPSVLDPTITIINTSPDGTSYAYDFGGVGTSTEENPTFTFPATEEESSYVICQTVTNDYGCEASVCQEITIIEEVVFYVPNVFTPDGDDYNETFFPVFTSGVDPLDYHLTIFNRWGEQVFESYNYEFGWPGTYGDQGLVEDGVYIWQIEFGERNTDKKQKHRGHVTVLK